MTTPIIRFLLDNNGASLAEDVLAGLSEQPKTLPSKWFYDDRGSELFEDITSLPEYYVTRREEEILLANAAEIAQLSEATELVELGAGNSEKTRALLDAMSAPGNGSSLERFVLFDVSEDPVRQTAATLMKQYPELEIEGIVGDFDHHLDEIDHSHRCLFIFLGGTIGNLNTSERKDFLANVASTMKSGDTFLLGTDLVKSSSRLQAAYNDSQGVTADFNLNILNVINQQLDANFELDQFEHVAVWDAKNSWVEMRLRSLRQQQVFIGELERDIMFEEGEEMRTEISTKFRPEQVIDELNEAGLEVLKCWTDSERDFQLTLARA